MKILITGANGMLGKAVRKRFSDEELILTDVLELDITSFEQIRRTIESCKPDVIINCAAYTAVDYAEKDIKMAMKVNRNGPGNLAVVAEQVGAKLVHISTDYVFGGDLSLEAIYKEDDIKNPQTVYGRTKLEGEKTIEENMSSYYIFRTAWLYGDGKNFVRTMLEAGKNQEKVDVVFDQHGSPTYTEDLADIIAQALQKEIPFGIYHATNLGFTTWYDFTRKIYEIANISCDVNPVTSEQFPRLAKRPANSMLSKEKILDAGIEIPSWEDALTRYLENEI